MAQRLGMREAAQMLQETLQEETQADKQLAQISKRLLKEASSRRPAGGGAGGTRPVREVGQDRIFESFQNLRRAEWSGGSEIVAHFDRPGGIRQWAGQWGAAGLFRGTGGKGDIGMLRLDFPGYSGEDSLEPIEWDEWVGKFEERGLGLLVQEQTADGRKITSINW